MKELKVFDPTTPTKKISIDFAPRPETLQNMRIGLVDNTKFNSDKLLKKIAALLERDYGAKNHIIRRKHNAGVPAHEDIIREFASSCDVIVSGIGD